MLGDKIAYGFAGIEPGSNHCGRDTGARNHRLAKTHRRIDLDQPPVPGSNGKLGGNSPMSTSDGSTSPFSEYMK